MPETCNYRVAQHASSNNLSENAAPIWKEANIKEHINDSLCFKQILIIAHMYKTNRGLLLKLKEQRTAANDCNGNLQRSKGVKKAFHSIVGSSFDALLTAAASDLVKVKEDVQQRPPPTSLLLRSRS